MQKRLPKGVYIKNIWDKIWNSRQPFFPPWSRSNSDVWTLLLMDYSLHQSATQNICSLLQTQTADALKSRFGARGGCGKPLIYGSEEGGFRYSCKNDRLAYVQIENWNTGTISVVEYTEQREMMFFFLRRKKNLENTQSSEVLYVNISNPECNIKYKPIFYILYIQITNVVSQIFRWNFKLISWNIKNP